MAIIGLVNIQKLPRKSLRPNFGNVVKVTYKGKWTDDNGDCELVIATTENSECVFILRSMKIIDDDYGINTWKKVFRFFNIVVRDK